MKASILIVEDERLLTELLSALLLGEGYELIVASDGEHARTTMSERTPDLIVSDLSMAGMDGFELLQWVRRDPETKRTPFVVLTAYGDEANRRQATQFGADAFIAKPLDTTPG